MAIIAIPLALLSGCATKKLSQSKVYGTLCSSPLICQLTKQVRNNGAFVYHLGDDISIVVPTNYLFPGNLTVVPQYENKFLNNIADLLNCYQKISVKIVVYISNDQQMGRARMHAQAIERYLTKRETGARLLYSVVKTRRASLQNNIGFFTRRLP